MAISLDRKSPGVFGILFGATMSIVLGALLAIIHLVARPVEVVSTPPKEPVDGVRYFIKGEGAKDSGSTLTRKRDALENPGAEVGLTESDLNSWATQTFQPIKVEDAERESAVMIIAGRPNFRLIDRELQVGMENELVFFGNSAPLVLQARGGFERAGERVGFKASEAYLGGLPLHRLPAAVMSAVANHLVPAAPEDLESVLTRASAIGVADSQLIVRLR